MSGSGLLDFEEINDSKIILLICLALFTHTAAVNIAEEEVSRPVDHHCSRVDEPVVYYRLLSYKNISC